MSTPTLELLVSIPLLQERRVDYLNDIVVPIQINNASGPCVLIESIALRFQSDWRCAAGEVIIVHSCSGLEIEPGRMAYDNVRVVPNLLFRPNSNLFDVLITYRRSERGRLSEQLTHRCQGSYLVVTTAPQIYGEVFISYKDPEDLELAKLLYAIAERAGFVPYIAPEDVKTGTDIWREKIPLAIGSSKAVFVIWSANTPFGPGVPEEIRIGREARVPVVPLLENGAPVPDEFRALSGVERTSFERDSAAVVFAKVIKARREMS
jgi:hypothetical protein